MLTSINKKQPSRKQHWQPTTSRSIANHDSAKKDTNAVFYDSIPKIQTHAQQGRELCGTLWSKMFCDRGYSRKFGAACEGLCTIFGNFMALDRLVLSIRG